MVNWDQGHLLHSDMIMDILRISKNACVVGDGVFASLVPDDFSRNFETQCNQHLCVDVCALSSVFPTLRGNSCWSNCMQPTHATYVQQTTAALSSGGGCLSGFSPFLYNRDSYKFETLAVMLVLFICSFPKGFAYRPENGIPRQ